MIRHFSIVVVALLSAAAPFLTAQNLELSYDVVIANGRAMDPESGLDAIRHIGIDGGKIVAISETHLVGEKQIDATGHVIAPGLSISTTTAQRLWDSLIRRKMASLRHWIWNLVAFQSALMDRKFGIELF